MRFSRLHIKTLKETPKEAVVKSHQLMLRSSMIKQLASGVYTYLPLGYRALKKIESIVREEMDRSGAQEIFMPVLQPAELWRESGRYEEMGPEMMRLQDRHSREFVLGPTHEEVITDLIRGDISSYKSLPVNLYQIQTKFRDERRPRFGLMRGREFLMKDGYSFHGSDECLDKEFNNMIDTYNRIFERCGLKFKAVDADSGAMGGDGSKEFHILAESGEDEIIYCDNCDYGANLEKATSVATRSKGEEGEVEAKLVDTPNLTKIEEVTEFLNISKDQSVKAIMYKGLDSKKVYMVLMRGDYEINEIKLKNLLGGEELALLNDNDIVEAGLIKGYTGPYMRECSEDVIVVADESVTKLKNHVVGGNKVDTHYTGVAYGRDYEASIVGDIRNVVVGETCPKCKSTPLKSMRGIEAGHVFKLGTKYSKGLNATFLDENGKSNEFIMGCYGFGVSRTLAATIEQNFDDFGIIWPVALAPYTVSVIPANMKDETQVQVAEKIYEELREKGVDALIDDRNERAGFKFKDSDLIGIPVKIIVGKFAKDGKVEVKIRKTGESEDIAIENIIPTTMDILNREDL